MVIAGQPRRVLLLPTHQGHQYHFARTGLPIGFLGHWDQFAYWRPKPPNVINLESRYESGHLKRTPEDYAWILKHGLSINGTATNLIAEHDIAWLIFRWQLEVTLPTELHKLYQVCKAEEIYEDEWLRVSWNATMSRLSRIIEYVCAI